MAEDKALVCVDCGEDFTFTAKEQERYAELGYKNDPKRCFQCREKRRQQKGDRYSRPEPGNRTYHTTQCAECGNEARVPFKPRGDKPVYCSDCFSRRRNG